MKKLYLLLIIVFLSACKNYEVVYSDKVPNERDLNIISFTIGENKNLLTFVKDFFEDEVLVLSDNLLLFNEVITTDENLDAARGIEFPKDAKEIQIKINNKTIILENLNDYRFIYVYKNGKKYSIQYMKKPILFN